MGIENLMIGNKKESVFDIISKLFENKNINLKTEVTDFDIGVIIRIAWFNALKQERNLNKQPLEIFMNEIIPLLLELKVSRNRKSREEAQKILSAVMPSLIQQESNLIGEVKK